MLGLEGVGDVLEEDEAEDDVLVLRRVHVVAQTIGHLPELGLEAEVGAGVGRGFLWTSHYSDFPESNGRSGNSGLPGPSSMTRDSSTGESQSL